MRDISTNPKVRLVITIFLVLTVLDLGTRHFLRANAAPKEQATAGKKAAGANKSKASSKNVFWLFSY